MSKFKTEFIFSTNILRFRKKVGLCRKIIALETLTQ